MEVVCFRNKIEKSNNHVKFNSGSVILDKILDCQISPFDKYCLGYKKEEEKYEGGTWSTKTLEDGPSFSKYESQFDPPIPAKDIRKIGGYQGVSSTPQSKFKKDASSKWNLDIQV